MSALVDAARYQKLDEVRRLLDAGVNVNEKDSYNNTAMIWAVANTQPAMITLLGEYGADFEVVTTNGFSAMTLAQRDGKTGLIQLMQEASAGRPAKEDWKKMGASTVAHVGVYPEIKKKITTIFNFMSRDRIVLAKDLASNSAEIMGPATPFDAISEAAVAEAYDQFTKLGGTADRDFVLAGRSTLDKPKMKLSGN